MGGDIGRSARGAAVLILALTAVLAGARDAAAQGWRGYAETTAHYLRLRPMAEDTVARSDVTRNADGTLEYQGQPVYCVNADQCVFYASQSVASAAVLDENISFTAWGFGVQGLSATGYFRLRSKLEGNDLVWPRSNDGFDAMLGYVELNRRLFRIRLGRQRELSGLGFSGYDGASVLVEPKPQLSFELYGGRSLAQGLDEPRNEALQGLESFLLDQSAYLVGGSAHLGSGADGVDVRYQREIWASRSSLISERASLAGRLVLAGATSVDASVDYDFGFGHFGKSHLTLRAPLDGGRLFIEATGRHYVPYFELWTIWGYFSPVAYDEGVVRLSWTPSASLGVWGSAGVRRYGDTNAPIILEPLKQRSERYGAGLTLRLHHDWSLQGTYTLEQGFGGYLNSGDASLRWAPDPRFSVSFYGTAFQQIEEFRVGSGAVAGGGLSVDAMPGNRVHLQLGATGYRNVYDERPGSANWNQLRLWTALRLDLGREPGGTGGVW